LLGRRATARDKSGRRVGTNVTPSQKRKDCKRRDWKKECEGYEARFWGEKKEVEKSGWGGASTPSDEEAVLLQERRTY